MSILYAATAGAKSTNKATPKMAPTSDSIALSIKLSSSMCFVLDARNSPSKIHATQIIIFVSVFIGLACLVVYRLRFTGDCRQSEYVRRRSGHFISRPSLSNVAIKPALLGLHSCHHSPPPSSAALHSAHSGAPSKGSRGRAFCSCSNRRR